MWGRIRGETARSLVLVDGEPEGAIQSIAPLCTRCGSGTCINLIVTGKKPAQGYETSLAAILNEYFILPPRRHGKIALEQCVIKLDVDYSEAGILVTQYTRLARLAS